MQEQLEAIIGEKAELKRAVEQAEQRLLFVPTPSPNGKSGSVFAMDPTPLKMVMDMKQRVQVSLICTHFPLEPSSLWMINWQRQRYPWHHCSKQLNKHAQIDLLPELVNVET